jgi:hypothetical protein
MRRLRAALAFAATVLTALIFMTAPAAAVDIGTPGCTATGNKPVVCQDINASKGGNPLLGKNGIVTHGVQIFLVIVGVVAVFVMLINGVKMITSNGDPASAGKARMGLIYAAIGLAVAMSAQLIITTIINKV